MANIKLQIGHYYRFIDAEGTKAVGEYIGTEGDFSCCICGKGHKAHCFNIYHKEEEWETWGYGKEHLPNIIEDLGTEQIINK
jgi:hypothetical protein